MKKKNKALRFVSFYYTIYHKQKTFFYHLNKLEKIDIIRI